MGRASGPTGQGQVTAEAVQRAASGRTPGQPRQRAGGHAPGLAGPSGAARPDRALSAAASNAAPDIEAPPEFIANIQHKSLILRAFSAYRLNIIQLLPHYLPEL